MISQALQYLGAFFEQIFCNPNIATEATPALVTKHAVPFTQGNKLAGFSLLVDEVLTELLAKRRFSYQAILLTFKRYTSGQRLKSDLQLNAWPHHGKHFCLCGPPSALEPAE